MYISQSHELEPMPFYAITGQITGSTYRLTPSWYFAPNFVKATFEFSFNFFHALTIFESEITASYASILKVHYK